MEKIREGESQKREAAGARKGRKVAKRCVFPVFCGSGGSKSRLAKAAGAEPAAQMRNEKLPESKVAKHTIFRPLLGAEISKKCTPLRCEALLKVKWQTHTIHEPLLEVGMSKECTPLWSEAHLEVKIGKTHGLSRTIFGSCCTPLWRKHISKSKVAKHTMFGPLLGVDMLKKCTPLWHEVQKHQGFGPLLDLQMSSKCRKSARHCGKAHFQVKSDKNCRF